MLTISLDGEWTLTYFPSRGSAEPDPSADRSRGETVPARVPGNVELDLERAGILPEIFRGDSILLLRQYETYEWWYEREFATPPEAAGRRVRLVFHGVDCLATYLLNGIRIGESDNALIEHSYDVGAHLSPNGTNRLTVRLGSPILAAAERDYEPMMEAQEVNWAHLHVRKPPHCYGWDIMPRAISAGLWRSVELVIPDECEITDLYLYTVDCGRILADGSRSPARLELFYQIDAAPEVLWDAELRVRGLCRDSAFDVTRRAFFKAGKMIVDIPSPRLWWPRGCGNPDLYEVTVELLAGGRVVASREITAGIRTVELDRTEVTSPDRPGQFLFRVNGEPVFCKGSNWVPADAFHSRDAGRYEELLALFEDLGCSMLRCWGGNVYEDHAFFDICDRSGIMVWQDFAMACALYPQDPDFLGKIEREAEAVIRKLRNHPSLAVWCGDNECDNQWKDPRMNRLTREVLPRAVMRFDGRRPYVPSSPYWAPEAKERGDRDLLPERHLWAPRDYCKSRSYTEHEAHFIGEIGYHGCPNRSSMERFLDPEYLWPWRGNPQWITHAADPVGPEGKWAYRIKLMADQIREMFGETPVELDDFILGSQISQAEAKKFFVEMTRIGKWRRTGILWWNVADGWPQFSDAVVDYYLGKKLAYHYLKRVQAPVCVMIGEPMNWHVEAVVGNDTLETGAGTYRIWDADSGDTLLEGAYEVPANQTVNLGRIPVSHADKRLFLISWTDGGAVRGNHYLLGFPPFDLERYRGWMEEIAALPDGFDAGMVGR